MFVKLCLHTNKRRPCSSTLSGHPSSSCAFWSILYYDWLWLGATDVSSTGATWDSVDEKSRKSSDGSPMEFLLAPQTSHGRDLTTDWPWFTLWVHTHFSTRSHSVYPPFLTRITQKDPSRVSRWKLRNWSFKKGTASSIGKSSLLGMTKFTSRAQDLISTWTTNTLATCKKNESKAHRLVEGVVKTQSWNPRAWEMAGDSVTFGTIFSRSWRRNDSEWSKMCMIQDVASSWAQKIHRILQMTSCLSRLQLRAPDAALAYIGVHVAPRDP